MIEVIKLGALDTDEVAGKKANPEIMKLAKEASVSKIYTDDAMAWCAVAMVALLLRAGKEVLFFGYARLRAASFLLYGTEVTIPMLGDILVFDRSGGKHVGVYIAEDATHYHTAGGNQGNTFNVTRIAKDRLESARRPSYKIGVPASVKQYFVEPTGEVSINEA